MKKDELDYTSLIDFIEQFSHISKFCIYKSYNKLKFLESIKESIFQVHTSEFWEIEDSGVSFYYLEEDKRKSLEEFFDWFKKGAPKKINSKPYK